MVHISGANAPESRIAFPHFHFLEDVSNVLLTYILLSVLFVNWNITEQEYAARVD